MPQFAWEEKSMRYMLCAFPLIGAASGALLWGFFAFWSWLHLGTFLFAAGLTLLPLLITGGIHLDGFCDTSDALASHQSKEKKLEILKDPHIGAFGAISLCTYLLLYFAFSAELTPSRENIWLLGLSFILSRCLSGLSVLCFPTAGTGGLLFTFRKTSGKRLAFIILLFFFLCCSGAMIFCFWPCGCVMVFTALVCLLALRLVSWKQFGGMRGDLAGWFLQVAELSMLAALVLTERGLAL